jgi:alpha-D-ribose 1-methylphosphonate 5-triphosphate diphosphatase
MQTLIYNAGLVLPDKLLENGWLLIEDGRIAALGEARAKPETAGIANLLDAGGSFLLPGLIDLHCDGIERLVEPRPGVHFELPVALAEVDHRLAACGITTEFHAIALDDNEFGTRSIDFARELAQALVEKPANLVRHEFHARFEITSAAGFEVICAMIQQREVRLVSLMDHSPGQGQYTNEQTYRDYVKRTYQRTDSQIDQMLQNKRLQLSKAWERIEVVTRLAREAGLAIATHDDDTPAKVEQWPGLGVTMAEFPTTIAAARRAHELGLAVCMGAPNVLRGKSSGGNLSGLEAVRQGICDVLCADYYPAAMLAATFKLVNLRILPLPEAVRLVTLNPARAVGLDKERGSLEAGKTADLVQLSLNHFHLPKIERLFVAGREKLRVSH